MAENRKFFSTPSHLARSLGVTPFKFMENLYGSWNFQATDGEDLVILACTVFDWSTRVTDRQTDGRTELQWLRRATGVPAFERNKAIRYCFVAGVFVITYLINHEL